MLPWLACLCLSSTPCSRPAPLQEDQLEARLDVDGFMGVIRERLAAHAYFATVVMVEDRSAAPIVMFLQRPQVAADGWQEKLVAAHGPWLVALERQFRELFVGPLSLQRRGDTPANVVCVLQTSGDFANYDERGAARGFYSGGARFERRSRWTVTYDHGGTLGALRRRRDECGEFVRALFQSYYTGAGGEPLQEWFVEGLAGYMVDGLGTDPATLEKRAPLESHVELLTALARDELKRSLYLRPLSTWARAPRLERYSTDVHDSAARVQRPFDLGPLYGAYHAQAVLWTHYLLDARDGQLRPRLQRVLSDIAIGQGGEASFQRAFEGLALAELEREFYRWVFAQYQRLRPQEKLDPALVERMFEAPGAVRASAAPATFDVSSLRAAPEDFSTHHGLALQLAAAGRLTDARQSLAATLERARGGNYERVLERELARLEQLLRARDAFVAEALASGAKSKFELDGKSVVAKFERLDGDAIVLGENRQQVARLPLTAITSAWLGREFPKSFAAQWVRAYAQLLAGDERWRKAKGEASELALLLGDGNEWFSSVMELGAAAQALDELAAGGVPVDVAGARECAAQLHALLERFAAVRVVRDKRETLGAYADIVLRRSFELDRLGEAFPGKFELLGESRVRWTLSFDEAADAHALVADERALTRYRATLPAVRGWAGVRAEAGALLLNGACAVALPLEFAAPLSCRLTLRYAPSKPDPHVLLLTALCEDGDGNYAGFTESGGSVASDAPSKHFASDWDVPVVAFPKSRQVVGELREGRLTVSIDGKQTSAVAAGPRKSGRVVLFVHNDEPIEMHELCIEGALDPELAAAHWARARRAAIGL